MLQFLQQVSYIFKNLNKKYRVIQRIAEKLELYLNLFIYLSGYLLLNNSSSLEV